MNFPLIALTFKIQPATFISVALIYTATCNTSLRTVFFSPLTRICTWHYWPFFQLESLSCPLITDPLRAIIFCSFTQKNYWHYFHVCAFSMHVLCVLVRFFVYTLILIFLTIARFVQDKGYGGFIQFIPLTNNVPAHQFHKAFQSEIFLNTLKYS